MAIHILRREFIVTLGGAAMWLFAARAQQSKKTPRLCFLTFDPGTLEMTRFKPFFRALRDLGYIDGQTITIDYLSANCQGERFPSLAADCVRLEADVIVVTTTPLKLRKPRLTAYPSSCIHWATP
jgi:putative ABC transport system substrate-binding protein